MASEQYSTMSGIEISGHTINGINGHQVNGLNDPQTQDVEMVVLDKAEKLKARLYSYAPLKATVNPFALRFKGPTQTQIRQMKAPLRPKIEPLVRRLYV